MTLGLYFCLGVAHVIEKPECLQVTTEDIRGARLMSELDSACRLAVFLSMYSMLRSSKQESSKASDRWETKCMSSSGTPGEPWLEDVPGKGEASFHGLLETKERCFKMWERSPDNPKNQEK